MHSNMDIQKIIPHRYPFLLIDKIIEVVPGKKASALKCVSANDSFFGGMASGEFIMPPVLIVESMAQTACAAGLVCEENKGKTGVFTGIEYMEFKRDVVPGDVLILETEIYFFARGIGKARVTASVDGQVAAKGEISFFIMDAIEEK